MTDSLLFGLVLLAGPAALCVLDAVCAARGRGI